MDPLPSSTLPPAALPAASARSVRAPAGGPDAPPDGAAAALSAAASGASRYVRKPTLTYARPAGSLTLSAPPPAPVPAAAAAEWGKRAPATLAPLPSELGAPVTAEALAALPARKRTSRYVCVSEVLLYATMAGVLAAAGVIIWYLAAFGGDTLQFVWAISGVFVCFSVAISVHDIHLHLTHYVSPLQRYYVRIIVMIIIYSVESWLALFFIEVRAERRGSAADVGSAQAPPTAGAAPLPLLSRAPTAPTSAALLLRSRASTLSAFATCTRPSCSTHFTS